MRKLLIQFKRNGKSTTLKINERVTQLLFEMNSVFHRKVDWKMNIDLRRSE
jgi:hypothetical protein|tara:strand:- start:6586 stop:6738 length:153 start_codon:yes stop_codon:yes gene_type:complete